jgi:hypothetical protein
MVEGGMSTTKRTLDPEQITTARPVSRRSAMRAVAVAAIGMTLSACHCSDSDPTDGWGHGRHCGGGTSGCSDSDPRDPGGNGTHCTPARG